MTRLTPFAGMRIVDPSSMIAGPRSWGAGHQNRKAPAPTQEFIALMDKAGIPFSKVNAIKELVENDEAYHTDVFVDFEDTTWGKIKHIKYLA